MKSVEQLKKEIESEYSWYTNDNGHEPNVAYVKCQWYGDDEPEDLVQTIALDKTWYDELSAENGDDYVVPYIKDEEVLYYCSSIDSLTELCEDNGVSDFKVVEFVGFEYLEMITIKYDTKNEVIKPIKRNQGFIDKSIPLKHSKQWQQYLNTIAIDINSI